MSIFVTIWPTSDRFRSASQPMNDETTRSGSERMRRMPADSGLGTAATPMVSVVGEAVLRAEPDEAMVVVTLSALDDALGPALQDVASRSDALVALLDDLQIAPSDRASTGVSVQEDFDHTSEGRRSLGHRRLPRSLRG